MVVIDAVSRLTPGVIKSGFGGEELVEIGVDSRRYTEP